MNCIQWGAVACVSLCILGCIGENPKDKTSPETTETATSNTNDTATPQKSAEPGTPSVEPAVYQVRTPPASILQHYFQLYAQDNIPLDKRDEHDSRAKIKNALEKLPKWSEESTKWTDQHGTLVGTPPAEANVRIVFDNGASAIATDDNHVVQNLMFDKETGLYIPAETSILGAKVSMNQDSWCDVRGRMGSAVFDMEAGSVLDLTNGYGLLIDHGITDLSYDKATTETGVLDLKSNGELRINKGTIMLHKANIQGNLGVHDAVFNLQTRRDSKTDNITFVQTAGRIYPLKTDSFPQTLMTVNGHFQFKTGSEIELFVTQDKVSKIVLKYPFSKTGAPKPTIEGKLRFTPYQTQELNATTEDGMVIIESDLDFEPGIDVSQLITHNILLKKRLSIVQKSKALYLKVENTDVSLSATPQLQQAIETFRLAEFKTTLCGQRMALNAPENMTFFSTGSQYSDTNRGTSARVFGLNSEFPLGFGKLSFLQMVGQASINDYDYRFLAEARQPFWALHHKVTLETPLRLEMLTVTPSIGLSHWVFPNTVFQDNFQTVYPEVGLNSSFDHRADTDTLTISLCCRMLYARDKSTFNELSPWVWDGGVTVSLKTQSLTLAISMINPLSLSAQSILSFQYVY